MGDTTGFLKHGRELPTRREVPVRLKDWREVYEDFPIAKVREHILASAEGYPTLSTSGFVDAGWSDDELFAFGLDRVLDRLLAGT